MTLCTKGKELLKELQRSEWLPPYNEELVRQTVDEINALHGQILEKLRIFGDEIEQHQTVHCGLIVNHQCVLRNKRCILSYQAARMKKIRALRWETGAVIPEGLAQNLSRQEIQLFHAYDQILGDYMDDIDLDLSADANPPKSLYVEVRVLEDCGEVMTENGLVNLEMNSTHFVRRADVESLILQGFLQQDTVDIVGESMVTVHENTEYLTALAKNQLSSILSLAFPNEVNDFSTFYFQRKQLKDILVKHNIFGYVTEGKALRKFQYKIFEMIDQESTPQIKTIGLEMLLVLLEQSNSGNLDKLLSRSLERVLKLLKYQQKHLSSITICFEIFGLLSRNIDAYSSENRKEFTDFVIKIVPATLVVLSCIATNEWSTHEDQQAWACGFNALTALLLASPNSLRSFASKVENMGIMILHVVDLPLECVMSTSKCLALLPSASDKKHHQWKLLMERCIQMMHFQLDILAGKSDIISKQVLEGKICRNKGKLDSLPLYFKASCLSNCLDVLSQLISQSMESNFISERDIVLVFPNIVSLCCRAFAIQAAEVGKQSGISEDGYALPVCVLYSVLPDVMKPFYRILACTVRCAGISSLRYSSLIFKALTLAYDNSPEEIHVNYFACVEECINVLGASTYEKVGKPIFDKIIVYIQNSLSKMAGSSTCDSAANKELGNGKNASETIKGRKRRRQVDTTALSDVNLPLFVTRKISGLYTANINAALKALSSFVLTYGGLVPPSSRNSMLRLIELLRRSDKLLLHCDSMSHLLISNMLTADHNGCHGNGLVDALDNFKRNPDSTLSCIGLNACESILHPRAPPIAVNFQDSKQNTLLSVPNGSNVNSPSQSRIVSGNIDWEAQEKVDDALQYEAGENKQEEIGVVATLKKVKMFESNNDGSSDFNSKETDTNTDDESNDYEQSTINCKIDDMTKYQLTEYTDVHLAAASTRNQSEIDDDEFPDII